MCTRVTINKKDDEAMTAYNAVMYHSAKYANQFLFQKFNKNKNTFVLDQDIYVGDIKVSPKKSEQIASITGYREQPDMLRSLVIDGPSLDAIKKFIDESEKSLREMVESQEMSDNTISIFTYDCSWSKEFTTPSRTNIYLPDNSFSDVLSDITYFYDNSDEYTRLNIPYTRTYMLYGVPGTGKTSLIYTLASKLKKNIAVFDFTEQNVTDADFRHALYKLPRDTILCIEDIDSLFVEREAKTGISFSGMLNVLDGMIRNTGMVVFMTTNYLKNIDDAAMKRRIDYYMEFTYMKKKQVLTMVEVFFPGSDAVAFYESVKSYKLTPCILQKFFVRHLKCSNILDHLKEFEDMYEYYFKETVAMYT